MKKERLPVYYSKYLQLDKILDAQSPESAKEGIRADDEMLFIIIHQTYELWFKQILHELSIVLDIFKKKQIINNSPDIYNAVHRLQRIGKIMEVAVAQMSILETMTPLDFLDFRDLLRPASGFQSIQFKMIEAQLGLQYEQRHGLGYYLSQLNEEDRSRILEVEKNTSLFVLINDWLERMPFIDKAQFWPSDQPDFIEQYLDAYKSTLANNELHNVEGFINLFLENGQFPEHRKLSRKAGMHALFIMLYRDYPLLTMPYQLLSCLMEIDEQMSMWRYRHIHMVQRTIGNRTGTGGSTGAHYLKAAADSHVVFKDLADLTSYLLPRHVLPTLPEQVTKALTY